MVFRWPGKHSILKVWIFLVSLTSYDVHQCGWAWMWVRVMKPQKFNIKVYGGMYFPGQCVHF